MIKSGNFNYGEPMKKSLLFSFSLIGQIGFATALPLVVFGLLGRYLDKKYHTSPWLFLVGLIVASVQVYFYLRSIVKKATETANDL